mgnify:CR=1 FL=1
MLVRTGVYECIRSDQAYLFEVTCAASCFSFPVVRYATKIVTRLYYHGRSLSNQYRIVAIIAAALACGDPVEPPLPTNAVRMLAPRAYTLWWRLTETCSRIAGDLESINWYVVPGAADITVNGRAYQGYSWPRTNTIVLAGQAVLKGPLVRHEMLHALAGREHRREYFIDRCDGVVACTDDCAIEAGAPAPPPSDASEIPATALDVMIRIDPAQPSITADSGWIALIVEATNTHPFPIWARLTPVNEGTAAFSTFGYTVDCITACAGGTEYEFVYQDRIGFGSGQTRRQVFDRRLDPGTYQIRGFFNSDTTTSATLMVYP